MKTFLRYDDADMRVSEADRLRFAPRLTAAHAHLEALRTSNAQGFFDLPFDTKYAAFLTKKAAQLRARGFRRLLVVGIGGSDLGARALVRALGRPQKGMDVSFLSAPDPEACARVMPTKKDWKQTLVYVVSKSGGTLETLAVFLAVRTALIKAVGVKAHASHVIVTTEPTEGNPLLAFARTEGYDVLPHPLNVGGRFSILSVVGLFPAACADADIRKVLEGAQRMEETRRIEREECPAARFAANQIASLEAGRSIQVLMPYADALGPVGHWYRQLWAESLGKNGTGPTPIAALGPVDQHSQIQLYTDGPNDKTVTFVEIEQWAKMHVPKTKGPEAISRVGGLAFGDILHASRAGTAEALSESGRAHGTLYLPRLAPEYVGALLQFFLQATSFAGELLGIDTFDQPGVEAGKHATKRLLGI